MKPLVLFFALFGNPNWAAVNTVPSWEVGHQRLVKIAKGRARDARTLKAIELRYEIASSRSLGENVTVIYLRHKSRSRELDCFIPRQCSAFAWLAILHSLRCLIVKIVHYSVPPARSIYREAVLFPVIAVLSRLSTTVM